MIIFGLGRWMNALECGKFLSFRNPLTFEFPSVSNLNQDVNHFRMFLLLKLSKLFIIFHRRKLISLSRRILWDSSKFLSAGFCFRSASFFVVSFPLKIFIKLLREKKNVVSGVVSISSTLL